MSKTYDVTPEQAIRHALQLDAEGHTVAAVQILRAVLEVVPTDFDALNNLGSMLAKSNALYEALYRLDRALLSKPGNPMAISNRGMVLSELGHAEEAISEFQAAIAADPENPVFWNNLGNVLERLYRYEDAITAFDRTLALDPSHTLSYYNRGIALVRLNRRQEAIANFNRAIAMDPSHADSYYNRGIARLSLGDLRGGFIDYEWRLKTVDGPYYIGPFKQPQWTGAEPLAGRTILVHAEQGLGDTIQFLRYIPLLRAQNANVLLIMHGPVRDAMLFGDDPNIRVMQAGEAYPPFDYWTPLMSLAHCFGTSSATIPPPFDFGDYISPVPPAGPLRVGVCWSGNWKHKNDRHRSIALAEFKTIMAAPGVQFVSLQKDVRPDDHAAFQGIDLELPVLDSMNDTAHVIGTLDMVVTVDTAVAHLAASIGVKTWILLPAHGTDWRWLIDRTESPWYPSAVLWRQREIGDWGSVLARVRAELIQKGARRAA